MNHADSHDRPRPGAAPSARPTRTAQWQPRHFSQPELVALTARRQIFQAVEAWTEDDVILRADSTAARGVGAQFVTPNYFGTLGVRLSAGQGLGQTPNDAPDMTAVMSFAVSASLR